MEEDFFTRERERMVELDLVQRDIRDPRVLDAFRRVPRHIFVPSEHRQQAYADAPLPIGGGQTISQPYIVALMVQLLRLKGDERVLEVGAGSGYQACILGELSAEVHTVERVSSLAENARIVLENAGCENVHVHVGDGSLGLPEHAPYDGIIVAAAAPRVPHPLLEQLSDGGRLVIPVGGRGHQMLTRWTRTGDGFDHEELLPVAFVPLKGALGWK